MHCKIDSDYAPEVKSDAKRYWGECNDCRVRWTLSINVAELCLCCHHGQITKLNKDSIKNRH